MDYIRSIVSDEIQEKLNKMEEEKEENGVEAIGVRDQFRLGGAEVSCPNISSIACPKIKWVCPNMT